MELMLLFHEFFYVVLVFLPLLAQASNQ